MTTDDRYSPRVNAQAFVTSTTTVNVYEHVDFANVDVDTSGGTLTLYVEDAKLGQVAQMLHTAAEALSLRAARKTGE